MFSYYFISFICLISYNLLTAESKYPFEDPTLSWDKRLEDLMTRMTPDEIANQTVTSFGSTENTAVPRLGIKPYVWITECIRGQINTNTTAYPHSIGLAAAFSPNLVFRMAEAISYEVRAQWNNNKKAGKYSTFMGLSCFSPVINILRHPLWGRNQETYGEDPYMAGVLVEQFVKGLQGSHERYVRVAAGCKHFDVHGGPENIPTDRFSFDAKVSERDWRMTFLPAFKACVKAGTYSMMCSYNSINGVPACANKKLLTDIARTEFGFKGFVVSDDGAVYMIKDNHHYTKTDLETAVAAIGAGCNLELDSETFLLQNEALKQGLLTQAQIFENVRPLLYTRLRLGEFDPEELNPYNAIDMSEVQSDKHRALALEAAMKSFVLLKNDNDVLPLKVPLSTIAVVGPFANATGDLFGNYASNVLQEYTTTVLDALKKVSSSTRYSSGCGYPQCQNYAPDEVRATIANVDVVFVCLGTGPSIENESRDRSDILLPGYQLQLLQDIVGWMNGRPVVLLLFNGGPLDITWAKESSGVNAIVECFFPAQSAGEAIVRTLTMADGRPPVVPAARLPNTWPANLNEVPPITDYTMTGRTYRYTLHTPLYPFGYGLSYSRFGYFDLALSSASVKKGDSVTVSGSVANYGSYDADEVVQVYLSWGNATVPVPRLQLVGFQRVSLNSGHSVKCVFTITADQMGVWQDDVTGFDIPLGPMKVYFGGQQPFQKTDVGSNVLVGSFNVVSA